eukprot:7105718-Prymnesium_polylepis.1
MAFTLAYTADNLGRGTIVVANDRVVHARSRETPCVARRPRRAAAAGQAGALRPSFGLLTVFRAFTVGARGGSGVLRSGSLSQLKHVHRAPPLSQL